MTKLIIVLLWNVTYFAKLEHFYILVLLGWLLCKNEKRAVQRFDLDFISAMLSQSCCCFLWAACTVFIMFLYSFFFFHSWDKLLFLLFLQSCKVSRDVLSSSHIYFLSVCAWMCVCIHLQLQFSCQVSKWTWVSCKSIGNMLESQELGMGPTCTCCFTLQGLVFLVYILNCVTLTLCVWEISRISICLSNS